MLAERVRSGLVETAHDGVVAIADADGRLIARSGDVERPFFLRSSAKPFQAHVSQEAGAELAPLELAMVSASHRAYPMHVALVNEILAAAGLDESHLRCPPAWPYGERARDMAAAGGARSPRRLWHNCSGKHAGFLRACVANGWPVDSYLEPQHPLQRRVAALVSELGGFNVEQVGVDGCGAPVLRTNAAAMARLFARLAEDPFNEVFTAIHRYPGLIAVNGAPDTEIAVATHAAAKGGAQGCLGVGLASGIGIAVKSWDGLGDIAGVAAVAALEALGALSDTARGALAAVASPPVLGGGRRVGDTESRLDLEIL